MSKDREKATQDATEARKRILNINVGILGHVDSGKTSLVKALSTSLSTAALDKHPQSQQRGITLDLGFSAFTLPIPDRLQQLASAHHESYDLVQFTLVDCPGHASLIRTVIGGAHIIDMIILVVDANKGIQTQTAECIVIGEITTDHLVIALNKIDMLPETERDERIEKVTRRIRKTLSCTKFALAPIVALSASVGGEKVAAQSTSSHTHKADNAPTDSNTAASTPTQGVDTLVSLIQRTVPFPLRDTQAPFHFAIDHCFPIRGHGTVLTGTVLSGSISVNQTLELPRLSVTRKVKSMQMFHQGVKYAKQGDRVGICVTNLDAKLVERDVACTAGSLPLVQRAMLCLVKKIKFFKFPCKSGSKVHVSVGHSTVMATVTFFGANELIAAVDRTPSGGVVSENAPHEQHALNSSFQKSFPAIEFDEKQHFLLQDELLSSEQATATGTTASSSAACASSSAAEPLQWALLELQQPVYCPQNSLVIGSRLDVDNSGDASSHCRLAFYGPLRRIVDKDEDVKALNIFTWKQKDCEVWKLVETKRGLCYEAIGWKLVTEGGSVQPFVGLKVLTDSDVVGTIASSFGADGMFRVKFPRGARLSVGAKLRFRFKRFIFDKSRGMEQPSFDESVADTPNAEEDPPQEEREPVVAKKNKNKSGKSQDTASAEQSVVEPPAVPAQSSEGEPCAATAAAAAAAVTSRPAGERRVGKVESIKSESGDGAESVVAVVSGLFRMEENVRDFAELAVFTGSPKETLIAHVQAPFGKMGKCKARLVQGATLETGAELVAYLSK